MTDTANKKDLALRDERGRLARGSRMGRPANTSLIERFRQLVAPDWPDIVAQMVMAAKFGDVRAAEFIGARMVPAPRPVQPRVVVPGLAEAATLEDKARMVISAGAQGLLGP